MHTHLDRGIAMTLQLLTRNRRHHQPPGLGGGWRRMPSPWIEQIFEYCRQCGDGTQTRATRGVYRRSNPVRT